VLLNWTFAKVQFTSVQLDSPALLTRLLTREPLEPVEHVSARVNMTETR
jgi:hypothetical protein